MNNFPSLAIVSTDWHLQRDNIEEIKEMVSVQCQAALAAGHDRIYCLGDVFESRISQRIDVLMAFYDILEICKGHRVTLYCIPGNHDKTSYTEEVSFLSPFKQHVSLMLVESYNYHDVDGIRIHMIPYFDESKCYQKYLDKVEYQGQRDVLFSHCAVTGSRNNNGTLIDNPLRPEHFSRFARVYLGHYHNMQTIGKILHIPSIKQHNFGENNRKGIIHIGCDYMINIQKTDFKEYQTVKIDLDRIPANEIDELVQQYDTVNKKVRLKIVGDKRNIEQLHVNWLEQQGFIVDANARVKIDQDRHINLDQVAQYDSDQLLQLFQKYCESINRDDKTGLEILKIALTQRNSFKGRA